MTPPESPNAANAPNDSAAGELLREVRAAPYRYDYFALLRRLSAYWPDTPRWGLALRPNAEKLRIGQEPSLSFAPAAFTQAESSKSPHAGVRLRQAFFGYMGPNGPLPIHLSDFIRERVIRHQDRTLLLFLDQFTHRFALHFYRAWAQAQPTEGLDRPRDESAGDFHQRLASLVGVGFARQRRDAAQDDARRFFAGWFTRQVRNRDGLQAVLTGYFDVPVEARPWHGQWMTLPQNARTHLGEPRTAALGRSALLGARVWDRHSHMRLQLGPMPFARFTDFLPDGTALPALQGLLRHYANDEWRIQTTLSVQANEVPPTRPGRLRGNGPRLGWTSWLGNRPRLFDAQDVRLDMDHWARRRRFKAAAPISS